MGRATAVTRQIRWYIGTLMGDTHYHRYVEHRARTHPGAFAGPHPHPHARARGGCPRRRSHRPGLGAGGEGNTQAHQSQCGNNHGVRLHLPTSVR